MKKSLFPAGLLVLGVFQACGSGSSPDDQAGSGGMAGGPSSTGGEGAEDGGSGGRAGGNGSGGVANAGGSGPGGSGGRAASGGFGGELPPPLDVCDPTSLGGALNLDEVEEPIGLEGALLIDNFDDERNGYRGPGLSGGWYAHADGTAGGVLDTNGLVSVEGGVTGRALRIQAQGFAGYGAIVGTYLVAGCLFDGSAYEGITFYARGSVDTGAEATQDKMRVHLIEKGDLPPTDGGTCLDGCYNSHSQTIELDTCWRRYSIRFDEVLRNGATESALTSDELYLVDFVLPAANSAELWLDELAFFTGDTPPAETICD